jgi:phosphoglucosamine mutase
MFGTSGIRGIYGKEVTEELAGGVANVFAGKALAIGRDLRKSGMSLREAVAEGAMEAGADVIDCGIVPTPTVALATLRHGCRGIMITASHNPPEYNGLKLIEKGKEIGKGLEKEVQESYGSRKTAAGKGSRYFDCDAVDAHKELVGKLVDGNLIRKKGPKVLVDCNGAACSITPQLLTDLGCRVTSINASHECFNRPSEPSKGNLGYLSGLIREAGADFAIAHDGDGDRCAILDDTGEMLPLDVQLAMMIEHELSLGKGKRIVSTVEASLTIRDVVGQNGGEIEITPVGSTYVGETLEAKDALFGGEPCGEYVYRDGVHVPDAVLAAAKFAEIFCMKGKFSELKKGYRQHFMAREKFPAEDKHAAMERIREAISIEGKIRDDDGIRIDEEDGWVLVRASGTEPIVRLTMEYTTAQKLEERKALFSDIIRKSV